MGKDVEDLLTKYESHLHTLYLKICDKYGVKAEHEYFPSDISGECLSSLRFQVTWEKALRVMQEAGGARGHKASEEQFQELIRWRQWVARRSVGSLMARGCVRPETHQPSRKQRGYVRGR